MDFYIRCLAVWLAAGAFGTGVIATRASAQAKIIRYICLKTSGMPTTLAVTMDGELIPVIRWTSRITYFSDWNRERRCKEISARLDTFNGQGRLKFLTQGRINGMPVICTALDKGLGCDGLIITLKPWQNADAVLGQLRRLHMTKFPLHETNSRIYISIGELLSNPIEL